MGTADHQFASGGRGVGLEAMRRLRLRDVCAIDAGLTRAEFDRIEEQFGFRFADDHRAFLAAGLPVNTRPEPREPGVIHTCSEPWPDWRSGDPDNLRARLNWPSEGVLFDVKSNNFWHASWGERPGRKASAVAVARRALAQVPRMVPVYGHRYLPSGAGSSGHPILSMWQTDVICYGTNLADYIGREFGSGDDSEEPWNPRPTVDFWRDLVDGHAPES